MSANDYKYLQIDKSIERQIRADKAAGVPNPNKFQDENITRRFANAHDQATLTRPAFARDIEKIINIPAYSRYSDKTQVFSFAENDDICRRGLHVQLVCRAARSIGSILNLNTDLIEAIALGHDTGHTPFGHAGERFLNKIYHEHTNKYFNHNVHSVRVLDKLYQRNISLQTLDGALCHNGEFEQQILTVGSTHTFEQLDELVNQCVDDESQIAHLRPSTLEGCVVRVCDMVAYIGRDRNDALDIGVLPNLNMFTSKIMGVTNTQILSNLTVDIINNSYGKDKICMSEEIFKDLKLAKKQNYEYIYLKEGMIDDTENIVEEMFVDMYELLLSDLVSGNENSPVFKHHVKSLINKSRGWTVEKYLEEEQNQIIVDYIASMTDSYFMALYHFLFPNKTRNVVKRGYCSDLV